MREPRDRVGEHGGTIALGEPASARGAARTTLGARATAPLSIAFVHACAEAPRVPLELLGAAGLVCDDRDLRRAGALRACVVDAALLGAPAAARECARLAPDLVVVGAEFSREPVGPDGPEHVRAVVQTAAALRAWLGSRWGDGPTRTTVALAPESTAIAEELLAADGIDLVLRGDPESVIVDVAVGVRDGRRDWSGVRGVTWRADERSGIRHEPPAHAPHHHATPAWDLVELADYANAGHGRWSRALGRRAPAVATLVTTRSCAPDCPTCRGSFGAAARDRSVDEVVREVRELVDRRGVRHLQIADRSFDGRPARALELANAIARFREGPGKSALRLSFPEGLRGDGLDARLIDALVRAGVRTFPLRVLSPSPRLQRLLKSNLDIGRVETALASIAARGARGHLELRLGLPTETTGEVARTIRWARDSRAHSASFLPGRALDLGPAWTRDTEGELDDFPSLRWRALRSFYSAPHRAGLLARTLPAALRGLADR